MPQLFPPALPAKMPTGLCQPLPRKILALGLALALGGHAAAQTVPSYAFSQTTGTYVPLTGGTVQATASASDDLDTYVQANLPIGFTFRFAGTNYTSFSLSANGFITLGTTAPTGFESPISSSTGYDAALAPFGADLAGNTAAGTAGELRYQTLGASPGRTLVVQFSNFQPAGSSSTLLNFQIRLDETSNIVRFAYGPFQVAPGLNTQAEVGLRGAATGSSTAYNNRATTTDWTQTTPGTSRTATMRLTPAVKPPLGLEFAFTPPNACPSPQQLSVNSITPTSAQLTFTAASPTPSGGYTATISPAPSGGSPQAVSGSPYNLTGLTAGTTYNVSLVSDCTGGGTSVPATVSFTTQAGCTAPSAVTASSTTTTTAQVNFTPGNGNLSFVATATPVAGGNGPVTASGPASPLTLTGLTGGILYNITVTGNCAGGGSATSAPRTQLITSPSPNDDPATAQALTINPTCVVTNGANVGATTTVPNGYTNPGCSGALNPKDVWYSFTTPTSGVASAGVRVTVGGPVAGAVRVFATANGASGPFTPVACSAGPTNNTQAPAFEATGLTPGTAYYISVAGYGSNDLEGVFTICLTNPNSCLAPPAVAANGLTSTSANIAFNASTGAATYTVTYTATGGTAQTATGATSPIALTGLTPATIYSATVRSNCGGGVSATSSPAISFTTSAPPCAAPTNVTAGSISSTSASISFGAGTSATSYTVTYTPQGGTAQTATGTSSPVALSGLTAATTYSVTVTSNCGGGVAATSSPAVSFTTSAAPCVAPINVVAGGVTQTSASIGFTGGAGATGYIVSYTPQGGSVQTASGSASPIALSGLTAATTYSVTVTSNCGGAATATSSPAVSFTTSAAPCVAPTNVAASGITQTSASIAFTSGAGATNYTVTYAATGGTAQTATGATSPIALTGLTPATTYSVTVSSNCGGQTATSAPAVSFTTTSPVTPCTAPTNVTATSITSTSASINFAASTGTTNYTVTYTAIGGTAQTATGTTSPIALSGLVAATRYGVTVTSNCGGGQTATSVPIINFTTGAAPLTDLTVNNAQNVQGSYNNVTITGPGVATLTGALTVAGTLAVAGALVTNCQVVSGPGSFVLQTGGRLEICDPAGISATGTASGAIQLAGTRTFAGDAQYVYNGTGAQATGTGLPLQVQSLTVANGAALTLTRNLALTQVLALTSGDLLPDTHTLLLLSVTGQGTALIDNTGGTVAGTGTMQRALDNNPAAGTGYRHYSSPVSNETVGTLAAPGFVPMYSLTYNNSATSAQTAPFPTVFGYDQGRLTMNASSYVGFDKGWFSPAATDAMLPTNGYTAQVPNGVVVDFTGTFNNGPQNTGSLDRTTGPDAGWHLLGNPYPSPLNWNTVLPAQRPGLDAAMYVYQSSGPYTGTYRTFLPGTTTTASPLIDAGSGYFVRVSQAGTPAAVNLTNGNRVTTFGPQPAFGRGTAPAVLALQLASATSADELLLTLNATAPTAYDPTREATKLTNPNGLNLAALRGPDRLAVAALPLPTAAETVAPLLLTAPTAGPYTLRLPATATVPAGLTLWLRDAVAGTQSPLVAGPGLALALPAGVSFGRFTLVLRPATVTAAAAPLTAATVGLYPNPAPGRFTVQLPPVAGAATATLGLFNALGQRIETRALPLTAGGASTEFGAVQQLPSGVYVLRIQAGAASITRRVVVE